MIIDELIPLVIMEAVLCLGDRVPVNAVPREID
jgi:hypothetical protein